MCLYLCPCMHPARACVRECERAFMWIFSIIHSMLLFIWIATFKNLDNDTSVLIPDEPHADNSCLIENIPRTPNKCVSGQVVFLHPAVGPWSWTPVDYIREEKQFTWYMYYCLKGLEGYDWSQHCDVVYLIMSLHARLINGCTVLLAASDFSKRLET